VTLFSRRDGVPSLPSLAHLLDDQDKRLVHEALADAERVNLLDERLRVLVQAITQASEQERRARDAVAQSEARYRNVFDSATDAIYTLDVQGSFTSVNEATCQLAGRTREELLGRNSLPLVATRDVAPLREMFKSAVSGSAGRFDCTFVRPDGTRRLAAVTTTPIRHGAQIIGILGVARDITDEREQAAALERSETRYTHLVESAVDGIFTVDRDGMMTAVNRSLEVASGRHRTTLIGSTFASLVEPRDEHRAAEAVRAAVAGDEQRIQLRYVGLDGDLRYCSLTLTPIGGESGGAIIGALGVVRDVTDERRLTDQLMQQEKLAAVGQLVSGVAHELNNPLASVMAFAQLLLASPDDVPYDRRAIEAIHQEAKRAAKIVSNLLTFARQHQPERRITDLNRVVDDTLELRRYALRNAQIDVETKFDLELPLTWADSFQLQQVVLNLLTNAEHALVEWGGLRRIVLSTMQSGRNLQIRIADSGPGVEAEHLDRIFNPFFTTKPVGEGTGLGLSISDGIVREHGGRIRIESQRGHGAAFIVEIPYAAPPDARRAEAKAQVPSAPTKRMLIVDDEAPLRQAMSAYFRSLGHVVESVGTGREAIARFCEVEFDTLLLDLRLPDMRGDEILTELRRLSREPRRVVFVTGDTQSDSARRVLEASGHPTVSKPFLLDDLASVVLAEATA
jgi:two-component system NtrC family sensor kinase